MIQLNYPADHILCQILKIILSTLLEKTEIFADNLSMIIYASKMENRNATGYYLELLTHDTTKLRESTENKITKDKNDENLAHLKITE